MAALSLAGARSSPDARVDPDERAQDDYADDGADDASEVEDVGVADAESDGEDDVAQQCARKSEREREQPRRRSMQLAPHVWNEHPSEDPSDESGQQRADHGWFSVRRGSVRLCGGLIVFSLTCRNLPGCWACAQWSLRVDGRGGRPPGWTTLVATQRATGPAGAAGRCPQRSGWNSAAR